jgi:hypothetical protein
MLRSEAEDEPAADNNIMLTSAHAWSVERGTSCVEVVHLTAESEETPNGYVGATTELKCTSMCESLNDA